jgi:hypothetical protein
MVSELEARIQSCEKRFKHRASTSPDMGDIESVDFVVSMIGDALQTAGLLPKPGAPITLNEIDVTLNVAAVHDEGGNLKFSVFGLNGDLGGSRRTDDTHTIKMSFQPHDLAISGTSGGTGTQSARALDPGKELVESFQELEEMVSAARRQALPRKATVILNFVVQEDFSLSIVAAGQAERSTTHSVCLRFEQPDTTTS